MQLIDLSTLRFLYSRETFSFPAKNSSSYLFLILLFLTGLTPSSVVALGFNLETIQNDLENQYGNISHIDGNNFSKLNHEKTIVFDVREQNEFDVSHLSQAIQVDPGISTHSFINSYKEQVAGKDVVFYCSVGQRSSVLASRLKSVLIEQGATKVYNLKGGIFRWRNEKKELIQDKKPTPLIHPYNPLWGLLIDDKKAIRFQPENNSK
jgi:rhodanese-related sulfurtransferase